MDALSSAWAGPHQPERQRAEGCEGGEHAADGASARPRQGAEAEDCPGKGKRSRAQSRPSSQTRRHREVPMWDKATVSGTAGTSGTGGRARCPSDCSCCRVAQSQRFVHLYLPSESQLQRQGSLAASGKQCQPHLPAVSIAHHGDRAAQPHGPRAAAQEDPGHAWPQCCPGAGERG